MRLAFEQLNLPIDAQNIVYGDLTREAGATAFDALIERKPEPTAVFCMSDAAAAGVIAQACQRGRRVPTDLSVVGCSDDLFAQYTSPPLTTIHLPAEEMAAHGVKEIDQMVRVAPSEKVLRSIVPVRLIERESVAPPGGRPAPGLQDFAP